MIHEALPTPTETAFGSHPCCVVSVTYVRTCCFHGAKRGFESLRGRQLIQQLRRDFVRITCTARTTDSPYYCPKLPPTAFQDFHLCDRYCSWLLQYVCRWKAVSESITVLFRRLLNAALSRHGQTVRQGTRRYRTESDNLYY